MFDLYRKNGSGRKTQKCYKTGICLVNFDKIHFYSNFKNLNIIFLLRATSEASFIFKEENI